MMETASANEADFTELRALAEEGRNRPLLGGRHFVLFGLAIVLASALHAAIVARILAWPPFSIAIVWGVVMGGASIIGRTLPQKTAALSVGNRVERAVWAASGAVLATMALGIFAFAALQLRATGDPASFQLFALMPPITFGVYAIALAASAEAARAAFLKPFAALSIAFLVLTVLLAHSVWQFAAMAAGALVVSVLPGVALLRRDPADG